MTSFIVIVPVLMFILSSINLLLTIKYQNDSRRIDSLRSQRDKIQAYAEKVVTACRVYLESQLLYARSRTSLEADKADGNEITVQRSTYVYGLKDAVLQNRIRLHVIMELMHIEIANSEFPNVKTKLEEMFKEFRAYSDQWDNQRMARYTDEELDAYADEVNKRIAAIVELFGRTQDQLTMSIHNTNLYADAMKHFKKATIDPLFAPITNKHRKDE